MIMLETLNCLSEKDLCKTTNKERQCKKLNETTTPFLFIKLKICNFFFLLNNSTVIFSGNNNSLSDFIYLQFFFVPTGLS